MEKQNHRAWCWQRGGAAKVLLGGVPWVTDGKGDVGKDGEMLREEAPGLSWGPFHPVGLLVQAPEGWKLGLCFLPPWQGTPPTARSKGQGSLVLLKAPEPYQAPEVRAAGVTDAAPAPPIPNSH